MLWYFDMTTQSEMTKINRLMEIIEKEKVISKVRLVMQSRISISYYEKLKPFLEELYRHKVRYDKSDKMWRAITKKDLDLEQ